ncbi:MAG: hypothetical protein JSR71_11470 [Proteobacteria bacterium]|nr:hypothetical protein [Pseudomonadota bacterium]
MKFLEFVFVEIIFFKLLVPVYVFFICLLRGLRIISRKRFEHLLFGAPEKMSDRPYPFD